MFKNLIDLASSTARVADATLGLVTKPISDGAKFTAESIEELLRDEK